MIGEGKVYHDMQDEQHLKDQFISFTKHLKKKSEKQMENLKLLDYSHTNMSAKKKSESDIFKFLRQKHHEEITKKASDFPDQGSDFFLNDEVSTSANNKAFSKNKQQKIPSASSSQLFSSNSKKGQSNGVTSPKEEYREIDENAVIVKGKLIYLKEEIGNIKSMDHLMHLLKQNGISYREYLMGDQAKILQKISENETEKEKLIINDYRLRNMEEKHNGEVLIMDRFSQVKDSIFN